MGKTEISCMISNIEAKLSSSLYLGSAGEHRYWRGALVKQLARAGHETRLRILLDDLLGPPDGKETEMWKSRILGIEKRLILEEVPLCCVKHGTSKIVHRIQGAN